MLAFEDSPLDRFLPIEDRLTRLESLLMHVQYDLDQLNTAVLRQQAELDAVRSLIGRLESTLTAPPPEPRDPQLERPPHY